MTSFDIGAAAVLHVKKDQPSALSGTNDEGPARGHAWQREMERAQMESWLSHGVVGHRPPAGATLLPSAVAAVAATAAPPRVEETLTADPAAAAPAPVSPGSGGASEAQPAEQGAGRSIPTQAHIVPGQTDPTAALADLPAQKQHPSLPPTASRRAHEVVASHPHWPPPGLAVAASVHALQQSSPLVETGAALREPPEATDGVSGAAPMSFDAVGLTQALQRFGIIEASTGPAAIAADSQVPAGPELEQLRGLLRADQVIAAAAGRTAEPPRGLTVAGAVHAELSLRPQAPDQRMVGPADRPAKSPQGPVANAAAEPIRVHADWSEDGVRVWLGMDPGALDSLEQITTQLHAWLNSQGLRLRSLSCNGQVLSQDPAAPEVPHDAAESDESAGATLDPIPKEVS